MSALEIRKVKTWSKPDFCANRCVETTAKQTGQGYRAASHVATICGHDTPLCAYCAKEWRAAWESALEPERVAA